MNSNTNKTSLSLRKNQILQSLVHQLEVQPGGRITTAQLARAVGVSEGALYRHFPSKTHMFEGLIEFIEHAIFSRIALIHKETSSARSRCEQTLHMVLTFAEKNPGMCRLLTGDALTGEIGQLHKRIHQIFQRLETQFKQTLREAQLHESKQPIYSVSITANLFVTLIEGKIRQYVRSEFSIKPTHHWDKQWALLVHNQLF